ncbi:HAUS augmin-like complex subunit 6 N-terminus-domain-containing protein [Xylariales sp. PMI_506]|nr:HAUS augmin-like complex subunit 6 N-terminus-domain-containing protein [Xylariales sp. PMI_506]
MSLQQTHTAPSRMNTKSLRVPPKPAGAAPPPSAASAAAPIPSNTSHVSLFLTNLRLLDLDLEHDWPDITPATFSARDAAGGQKKRIHCVEWALYHLFILWDDNEARNKLKPFYPPLDQVQSLNLRAALLRALEQAKRNGVLGRDAVIRKTMLDECKGERLEEVLAVFSSAVLKRLVAERALNSGPEYRPTVSEKIALENWGYSGERTELNGLILAHKVSISAALAEKNAARERYRDFEELLELKARGLARRKEQIKAAAGGQSNKEISARLRDRTLKSLRTNWTGSDQWVEAILYDDTGSQQGGLLATNFEQVWSGVRQGRLTDMEDKSTGLLEQLDHRVRTQQARLEKWEGFRQKLFRVKAASAEAVVAPSKTQQRGVDLQFTAHQALRPGAAPASDVNEFAKPTPPPDYAVLLQNMRSELDSIVKPRVPDFSKLATSRRISQQFLDLRVPSATTDTISDLSEWEDEPEEPQPQRALPVPSSKLARRLPTQLSRAQSQQKRPVIKRKAKEEDVSCEDDQSNHSYPEKVSTPESDVAADVSAVPQPTTDIIAMDQDEKDSDWDAFSPPPTLNQVPRSRKEAKADPPASPPRPISPTQAMADQILASMSNASPSPVKKQRHTLSLAERTRMSMKRNKSFEADDEYDTNMLVPTVPNGSRSSTAPAATITETESVPGEEYEDLVARTRRSMAGFEAARQKAQMERRRSQRTSRAVTRNESHFPRLMEEDETGDTSVLDVLLEAPQEDMEAIFKSRPKMRTSPAPSPRRKWDDDLDQGHESP